MQDSVAGDIEAEQDRRKLSDEELRQAHGAFAEFVAEWDERERGGDALEDLVDIMNRQLLSVRPVVRLDEAGRLKLTWRANPDRSLRGADILARAWGELMSENASDPRLTELVSARLPRRRVTGCKT